jgi:hypothetical protein
MDNQKPQQGEFAINLNFRRNGNPKAPALSGRISAPDSPDKVLAFDAFEHENDKGKFWIGSVDPRGASMRNALSSTAPERGTHFIAIRENGFKIFREDADGNPNPAYQALTDAEKKKHDALPSYWAVWTRGRNDPEIRAAAWERKPTRYGPWASGKTQYPQREMDAPDAFMDQAAPGRDEIPFHDHATAVSEGRA